MVLEMCLNIIWRHLDATLVTDTWRLTDLGVVLDQVLV